MKEKKPYKNWLRNTIIFTLILVISFGSGSNMKKEVASAQIGGNVNNVNNAAASQTPAGSVGQVEKPGSASSPQTGIGGSVGQVNAPGGVQGTVGEVTEPSLSLPSNFPSAKTSIKLQVVRYSYAGTLNDKSGRYTPIGGVNFTLTGIAKPKVSQSDNQTKAFAQVNKIEETIYNLNTPIIDDSVVDDIRRLGERVFTSAVSIPKLEGIIPDDGVTSAIIIPNLPPGDYQLQVSKSGFKSRKVKFSLGADTSGISSLQSIKLEPSRGAPPPSISANSDIYSQAQYPNFYFADAGEITYAYHSSYPWLGWQPKDSFISLTPEYFNAGEPAIVDSEGNPYWGNEEIASASDRCKSLYLQTGQKGINATTAALGALAGYILPRLGPNNGHVKVGDAAATGITAYLAAKVFGQPGTTISYDDCGGIFDQIPWQIPPQCEPYYACDTSGNCGYQYPPDCFGSSMGGIPSIFGFPTTGGTFTIGG